MVRQGKYTQPVSPLKRAKWQARKAKGRFQWFRRLSWKQKLVLIGGPLLIVLVIIPLATYLYFARDISDQDRLMNRNNTGVILYDNTGKNVIFSTGHAAPRQLVQLNAISKPMKDALVASEDKDFYKHGGFSILSTLRAVYGYVITGGRAYGGTTITQQLAKITLLSSNRSFLRQYQAFSVAVAIENTYSKDQILDMYLNSVFFGENAFGIEDAAKAYFGTTPDKLDLAQSSMLVGLLPAPNAYSPISGNATYAKQQQESVLTRMVTNGYITEAEKQAALAEQLTYQPAQSPINDSAAPHFTEMVLNQLYDKYGQETVTRSGYRVTTTLDMNVQNQLQSAVAANMKTIQRNGGSNASAVAIDPKSGEVRGLVGSYDWNDPKFGKVNMVTTARQPGSSFKPIYYSKALADGTINPATILKDVKTDFGGYTPLDADRKFRGDVTVRNALNWSLNIPAVEVMQKVGVSTAISTAQRMGITTIDPNKNYGLSLALGSAEVPLMQMTNAYASFANDGQQYNTTLIKNINSKYNDKVYSAQESSKEVVSPQGAYLISNILSDNASRSTIFGNTLTVYDAKTKAVKKAAVKTGTTDDSRDAWTIGYTPQIAIGVWVGNNDNTVMANGGSIMAGPIWTKAMGNILAGVTTDFTMPSGIVQRQVCSDGSLADAAISGKTRSEYFLAAALPTASCSVKPVQQDQQSQTDQTDNSSTNTPSDTTTTLAASPSGSAPFGTSVTFTATVPASAKGTVTFKDNGSTLAQVNVGSSGTASYTTSGLMPGAHSITASFAPDDTTKYSASTSNTLSYSITTSSGSGGNNGNGNGNGNGLFR
jgi:penicillin-binding protein 1C